MIKEDFSKYNGEGTPLRKVQLKMLEILVEIDNLCRKNDICYWIDFGTLLGAVRHKGFIPWDDDLDIYVHEKDFDRFQKVCIEQLPDDLFLQNEKTDPDSHMGNGMVKVRDKNSLFIHDFDVFRKDYNKGVFIDVFMAKTYPKMNQELMKYLFSRIKFAYGFYKYNPELNLKNIVCFFLYPFSFVFHMFLIKIMSIGKPYLIGTTPESYTYGLFAKIEDVFPLQEIEFEGHGFMAPKKPDVCLRNVYGDYIQIPPPEQRRTHVIYAFMDRKEGAINVKESF